MHGLMTFRVSGLYKAFGWPFRGLRNGMTATWYGPEEARRCCKPGEECLALRDLGHAKPATTLRSLRPSSYNVDQQPSAHQPA